MARKAGIPQGKKTGGRTKGTPNKRTTDLMQALAHYECSLPEQIATLFKDPQIVGPLKLQLLDQLMPYIYPQRKAIDPEGYLTVEQAAGMLGAQTVKFRVALQRHIADASLVALILGDLRASQSQSHS